MLQTRRNNTLYSYAYAIFTGLFDIRRIEWSEELNKTFDLPVDKLPRVVRPWNDSEI